MATPLPKGPAFLQELAPAATFTSTLLRQPVLGAEAVSLAIRTLVTLYASTTVSFRGGFEGRDFTNYEPTLLTGETLEAVVTLIRNDERQITHVNIGYSPLEGAVALAKQLEAALAG